MPELCESKKSVNTRTRIYEYFSNIYSSIRVITRVFSRLKINSNNYSKPIREKKFFHYLMMRT
jgi:hypothetical protein